MCNSYHLQYFVNFSLYIVCTKLYSNFHENVNNNNKTLNVFLRMVKYDSKIKRFAVDKDFTATYWVNSYNDYRKLTYCTFHSTRLYFFYVVFGRDANVSMQWFCIYWLCARRHKWYCGTKVPQKFHNKLMLFRHISYWINQNTDYMISNRQWRQWNLTVAMRACWYLLFVFMHVLFAGLSLHASFHKVSSETLRPIWNRKDCSFCVQTYTECIKCKCCNGQISYHVL